mmetsp:Transcript_39913/g.120547  ORF Transcript_39913/g.120547 Transcript_39913/m.120547 type:complete len:294 (+) Transcript_39913:5955-6836(+)
MNICRRISMGGWAPYSSLNGMFKSSMNTSIFLPGGGPKVPFFRLSNLPSTTSWVWLAVVCAENAKEMVLNSSGLKPFNNEPWMDAVFAVPVGPLTRKLKPRSMSVRMMNWLRHVSDVGTMMVWYCASLGTSNPAIRSVHCFHLAPSVLSMYQSWSKPLRGAAGIEPPPVMSTLVKSATKLNFFNKSFLLSMQARMMSQMNKRPSASVHAPHVHSIVNQNNCVMTISRSMKLWPMSMSSSGSVPSGKVTVSLQNTSTLSWVSDSIRRVAMTHSQPSETGKGVLTRCVHSSMTSK